jgi:hypothetical protein
VNISFFDSSNPQILSAPKINPTTSTKTAQLTKPNAQTPRINARP